MGTRASRCVLALLLILAGMPLAQAQDAASLKARHEVLGKQLASNEFRRPLYLESRQSSGQLQGDIYAVVEEPYRVVRPALRDMHHWCDILILHLNVKSCRASAPGAGAALSLKIGRKYDRSVADAYLLEFLYALAADEPDYLQARLSADRGPLGTTRYRIVLEVVALDSERSFLHLSYAYAYGRAAQAAMQVYLATLGRGKVGFTVVGNTTDGRPVYIGDMRGVVERNTMRYYLAIEAYVGALSLPGPERLEARLNDWYAGIERYPIQLHDLERREYLEMKRNEIRRQRTMDPAAADARDPGPS